MRTCSLVVLLLFVAGCYDDPRRDDWPNCTCGYDKIEHEWSIVYSFATPDGPIEASKSVKSHIDCTEGDKYGEIYEITVSDFGTSTRYYANRPYCEGIELLNGRRLVVGSGVTVSRKIESTTWRFRTAEDAEKGRQYKKWREEWLKHSCKVHWRSCAYAKYTGELVPNNEE
jgi:hypothetical protein